MPVMCRTCEKVFSTQYNLNKHSKKVHHAMPIVVSYDKTVYNYKCLEIHCNCSFRQNTDLVYHLQNQHQIDIQREQLFFKDFKEFSAWKEEVEVKEKCNYIISRGKRVTSSGAEISYYICNRSGVRSEKTPRNKIDAKRLTKSQGSCKSGQACISQITVQNNGNANIEVTRQKTHYGHKVQIEHLRLSTGNRKAIASKIINGASKIKVLDMNRNKIGHEVKRADLLTLQDIKNITRSFKLEIVNGVKHVDDATSIDLCVKEFQCNETEDNPVLVYKKKGDVSEGFAVNDFCLILMNSYQEHMLTEHGSNIIAVDSTHGLNQYDFEMTTVLVVDEFGEGFPVAYLFTNRKDTYVHTVFFESIKSRVGIIQARTFMSDITTVFYNAWMLVMGPVSNQLFCAWHIDRAWQKNLSKINIKDKREWVYKTLKVLQSNLDPDTFKNQLETTLNKLLDDADTRNFGLYFKENYCNNFKQWAMCHRKGCGINTNMRLESMHKVIKYLYLNKKKVKRLDKGLHAVLKYTRDKIVDRLIKHTKGKYTVHTKEIIARHRTALASCFDIKFENNKWKVCSKDQEYYVEKQLSGNCCNMTCNFCKICFHEFSCMCTDYFVKSTICKHIHYFVMNHMDCSIDHEIITEKNEVSEEDNVAICMSALTATSVCPETIKETIESKLSGLQTKVHIKDVTSLNEECFSQILSNLKNVEALLDLTETKSEFKSPDATKQVSANANIEKQQRFHSTQNKRKNREKTKKATSTELKIIQDDLKGRGEFISYYPNHDHAYF